MLTTGNLSTDFKVTTQRESQINRASTFIYGDKHANPGITVNSRSEVQTSIRDFHNRLTGYSSTPWTPNDQLVAVLLSLRDTDLPQNLFQSGPWSDSFTLLTGRTETITASVDSFLPISSAILAALHHPQRTEEQEEEILIPRIALITEDIRDLVHVPLYQTRATQVGDSVLHADCVCAPIPYLKRRAPTTLGSSSQDL